MPAPRPVNITYGNVQGLGQLALGAGRQQFARQEFDRQRALDMQFLAQEMNRRQQAFQFAQQMQMQQQSLEQQRAFAMQDAYAQRPGARVIQGGQQSPLGQLDPSQQAAAQQVQNMLQSGQIDEATANRMLLGVLSGSPSLAELGMGGSNNGMTAYQRNQMLTDAADAELEAAKQAMQDFVQGTPGGLQRIQRDAALSEQYKQLQEDYAARRDAAIQLRRQLAGGGQGGPTRTGAVADLPGGPPQGGGQAAPQGGGQQQGGGSVNDMPVIQSDEERDRLPSGSFYIGPDGKVRRKR